MNILDQLKIGNKTFNSRLMLGTGKYKTIVDTINSIKKSECEQCGFSERRITDYKIPLLLNFKDGNKCNYLLDNVNLLCYNCYFLLGGGSIGEEVFTENQIRQIESNQTVKEKPHNLEMDDDHYENMKALGLVD